MSRRYGFAAVALLTLTGLPPSRLAPATGPVPGLSGPVPGADPCREPGVLPPGVDPGLHCIELVPVPDLMAVTAAAILGRAASPYGVAVTADGRPRWAVSVEIRGLPAPSTLGPYRAYVAWAMTPMLESVTRLGEVRNGRTAVGEVALDKFLLLVSAEPSPDVRERSGPPVLRGFSPSWLMQPHDETRLPPRQVPHRHAEGGWQMPPMHPMVPVMVPGLEALIPAEPPWRPGAGLDLAALPAARPPEVLDLADGDTLRLVAAPVRRTIAGRVFVGYGYNGQVPGPLVRASRGATILVDVVNRLELPTAVHWHGIRLDNPSDGVPGHTQPAIAPGDSFRYRVRLPDAGLYWYHPHVREDATQDLGLAGNIQVRPPPAAALPPVGREAVLMLDDMLLGADGPIPWGRGTATHALMGRFGNVLLVNGEPSWQFSARAGEVVRLWLTNAASTRVFNLSIPGGRLKLVGGDVGPYAREEWVDHVVLAPAERYIVDLRFEQAGRYPLLNRVHAINHPAGVFFPQTDTLGVVEVTTGSTRVGPTDSTDHTEGVERFDSLRVHAPTAREIDALRPRFAGPPEKQLVLSLRTRGLPFGLEQVIRLDTGYVNPVEWDGTMPMMDWLATGREVEWILRDPATGRENHALDWRFRRGELVRLRIVNERRVLHPMYHSIHLHGQRFLVAAWNGAPNASLVWKDTVLVPAGSTVDLLVEFSNPGRWMLHCHLAEHLETGMHSMITVQ